MLMTICKIENRLLILVNRFSGYIYLGFLIFCLTGCTKENNNLVVPHDHSTHDHNNSNVSQLKGMVIQHTEKKLFVLEMDFGNGITKGKNNFFLVLKNHDGLAIRKASVMVIPFMTAHGHGSSANPVVSEKADGKYQVENVVFQMMGEWDMTIKLTKDGMSDSLKLIFNVR